MTTPRIELDGVSKTFTGTRRVVHALDDISFRVMPGEFVTVIGPSGSGKSTLFNIMAGLLAPDHGAILFDGERAGPCGGRVGYMPQRDLLMPWRTVLDNVIIAQEIAGVPRAQARAEALGLFPRFGLAGFEGAYPAALSGGMRQRAALLRTVLTGCDVLLLDEPFGALDALTRRQLQDWLLTLQGDLKKTMVFITHDVDEAVYLADRVIVLSARPGRVIRQVEVDLPRPRRQGMVTEPRFGALVANLLESLGVEV